MLYTDRLPLVAILGPTTDVPCLAAARLQHWGLLLSGGAVLKRTGNGECKCLLRLELPCSEPVKYPVYSYTMFGWPGRVGENLSYKRRMNWQLSRVAYRRVNG
ncbi:hypothetical protein PR048_026535 [Dryococelus australis]|uniref:Uncharacterized protein n=1 Tax=Dryococelus australis TaxID=614101 RepID=A0ABQ9GLN6_9NEOP|nr:hypothetical protein PR048_026535 [Dryococelus australis]